MARIKGGMNAKKKHNRVLKLAKGYRGARSKQYRIAKQSVMRALATSYAGRKERKRQFRQLWIARINAAARINGLSYSKFMSQEKLCAELQRRGCDIGRTTYAKYESGELNIKASVIVTLKKIYNCSYDDFFAGLEEEIK